MSSSSSYIQQTSLQSYYQLQEEGKLGLRQRRVFLGFRDYGSATDLEMCKILGFHDPNMLRPRRRELVKEHLLQPVGKRQCRISGRMAIVWGVRG